MAGLSFDITGNNENFLRKLEETRRGVAEAAKQMQLEGKKVDSTFNSISFGDTLKKQIYEGSQSVNGLTDKIIKQKTVIKDIEQDVRNLGEAYKRAGAGTPKGNALFADFKSAKAAAQEEKNALFDLQTQQAQSRLSVRKLKDEYSLYQKEGQNVVDSNNNMALSFKKTIAAIGGIAAIKRLGSEIIKVRGEFQSMQTAIETLVGKDMAGNLIPQIKELAKVSPLTLSDMIGAEKMMLGFNIQAEDTIKYLKALGDISMGDSQKFNSLTLAFSQMSATGKLMGQDLNQMINAGFNPLQTISEKTGKSIAALKDEMSKGAVSAEMVQQAFLDATSAGGKFYQMSENASKTINGQLSMMQDALDEVFNEIGTNGDGVITTSIQTITKLIQNYETVGKILTGLVGVYGVARAAVMLTSLENGRYIFTLSKLKTALKSSAIAQKVLNLAVLKNPYVMAAVAVGTLVAAVWTLHDSTTAAEKAQDRYNKKVEGASREAQDYKQNLEGLISELQNEVTAETRKMEILDEMEKGYPSLFRKFIDEKGHIKDLTEAWKAYNEEASKNKAIQNKANASDLKQSVDDMKRIQEVFDKYGYDFKSYTKDDISLYKKYKPYDSSLKDKIEESERELWKWEKEVRDNEFTQWKVDLKGKTDEQIKAIREAMVIRSKSAKGDKNLLSALGQRIIALDNESNSRKPVDKTGDKSYWDKQKKEAETALEFIDSKQRALLNAGKFDGIDTSVVANYKNQSKLLKEAQKELNAYDTSGKQENKASKDAETLRKEQEKYNLLLDKQTRERKRMEEDSANELEQLEIDRLKEGSEKVLEQRKFNHEKELESIEREAQDKKAKAIEEGRAAHESNPDKKKKPFNAEEFIKSEPVKKQFAIFDNVAAVKTKTENTKYNRGDDLSSLLNEYQDYTDKRLAIETKFNNDLAILDEQRKQAVKNGDTQQIEQIDRAKAQGEKNKKEDLSGVSLEEFKADIDWATLFGNLDVLSPESLNKLRDKLKVFIETAADKLKPEDLKVLSEAMTNVDLTIADKTPYEALKTGLSGYKTATEDAATAQAKLNKLQKDGKEGTEEYEDATKELTDAQRKRQESLKTMTQATNNIGEKGQAVVTAGSDITDMLTSLGVSIPESLAGALDGMGQVMSSLASVDLMKPMSILTGITGTLAGLGKTIGSLFGGSGNKSQKDTERLEATTKRLAETEKVINSFIEKRIELLKSANMAEQKNIAATTQASIDNQKKYNEQLLDGLEGNWLLAKAGKNNNLTLKDLGITSIEGLEEFLSSDKLLELQKNGYSIRDAEQWRAIIDGNNSVLDKEKELHDTMAKNRTGISLDEAKNSLDSFVRDADASFEDVADSFEDHMRDAMFNIVKQNYLNKEMEKWYADLDKAMLDGVLDETEAKESKKKYEDAYAGAQERYLAALEAAGISAESDSTREASAKGIATASQDSVDENNGRLTMIQGHTYNINESVTSISSNTEKIAGSLSCLTNIDKRMSDMIRGYDTAVGHLSNIEKYTENLVEMKQYMYSMKQGIDSMNTKGLILKR